MKSSVQFIFLKLCIIIFIPLNSFSQSLFFKESGYDPNYFRSPIDFPIYLSGNFGEIRSAHFHAGLDIKTGGEIGKKVYAAAEGYISRIKIQTNGYGRSLYITHPNGLTTVYAHLSIYNDEIEKYVKNYQYKHKTHKLDLYLLPDAFPVTKGQQIALSGNSGSSGGPHLHFEIRETDTQTPLNGLFFNLGIIDNIKPKITQLIVYPLNSNSYVSNSPEKVIFKVSGNNGSYILNGQSPIVAHGIIGIGVEAFDYINGSSNLCGVYSIELLVNDTPIYKHHIDKISFEETGYIDAHIDYEEQLKTKADIQRTYLLPNNHLSIYSELINNGRIILNKDTIYNLQVKVEDVNHDQSQLRFKIRAITDFNVPFQKPDSNYIKVMNFDQSNYFENQSIRIDIPAYSLFDSIKFNYSESDKLFNSLTKVFSIENEYVPLHSSCKLVIKDPNIPDNVNKGKVVLVQITKDNDYDPVFGSFEGNNYVANISYFGNYTLMVDSLAPTIKPLNIFSGANMSNKAEIQFTVKDSLSGINLYNGYIDDEWALFEYDPKNDLIQYVFDTSRITKNAMHNLKLEIIDKVGNMTSYSTKFYY